jgi:glutathione S-transferase
MADELIAGRDYIVPNRFTIADIIPYCCLDFAAGVGQTIDPSLSNLHIGSTGLITVRAPGPAFIQPPKS